MPRATFSRRAATRACWARHFRPRDAGAQEIDPASQPTRSMTNSALAVALLAVRQPLRTDYRALVALLAEWEDLRRVLAHNLLILRCVPGRSFRQRRCPPQSLGVLPKKNWNGMWLRAAHDDSLWSASGNAK